LGALSTVLQEDLAGLAVVRAYALEPQTSGGVQDREQTATSTRRWVWRAAAAF